MPDLSLQRSLTSHPATAQITWGTTVNIRSEGCGICIYDWNYYMTQEINSGARKGAARY